MTVLLMKKKKEMSQIIIVPLKVKNNLIQKCRNIKNQISSKFKSVMKKDGGQLSLMICTSTRNKMTNISTNWMNITICYHYLNKIMLMNLTKSKAFQDPHTDLID